MVEPGQHETEETYVILEGEGTLTLQDGKRTMKKGDFVYLPPRCLHGIENTGHEAMGVLSVPRLLTREVGMTIGLAERLNRSLS